MELQDGVFKLQTSDFSRVLEVWEASVRATHHFVSEDDIQFFRPLIWDALPSIQVLAGVRDHAGQVAGFVAVVNAKIEMLFIHPLARGKGAGRRLVAYAVDRYGAGELDVNEQNEQAVGFYLRMGFALAGRSEVDGTGKPYPLLHMRLVG